MIGAWWTYLLTGVVCGFVDSVVAWARARRRRRRLPRFIPNDQSDEVYWRGPTAITDPEHPTVAEIEQDRRE